MRDLDKNPYSADEQRVAKWLFDLGVGGGDDPIGFLIVSHETLAVERNALKARVVVGVEDAKRIGDLEGHIARLIEVYAPSERKEVLRKEIGL